MARFIPSNTDPNVYTDSPHAVSASPYPPESGAAGPRPSSLTKMTTPAKYSIHPNTHAFFFDVFGTCVDWRKSVTNALHESCVRAVSSPALMISPEVRRIAETYTRETWGEVAQEWRNTYYQFTRALAKNPSLGWKTVDQHHLEALRDILTKRGLVETDADVPGNLWDEDEVRSLSTVWHRLESWPDTNEALDILNQQYVTTTLSNGNVSLLRDMQVHSGMHFTHTFSSEIFGTYKPNPAIYLGAAGRLGVPAERCVMVAAHLGDLEAAKGCGLQTIYIERPQEETADVEAAKKKGFVDVWVKESEGGFLGMVDKLGISVDRPRRRSLSAPPATAEA